jgi:acetyl-CoA acetyltransferase family protein
MRRVREEIVLVEGRRTPFGAFGGGLKEKSAADLGVAAGQAALEAGRVEPGAIEALVVANVQQTSVDAIFLARHIGLRLGCRIEIPTHQVNRLCGSGFEAIAQASNLIELGTAEVVLAVGTEAMSQSPHVLYGARWGFKLGTSPELVDSLWRGLVDSYTGMPMDMTAEKLAEQYGISRQDCDRLALRTQQRYAAALARGDWAAEMAPVTIKTRKGEEAFARDEHPRPETTIETLAKLPPVFKKDGTVTAGNASGIVDGAAAMVVTRRTRAEREGWPILARLVSWAAVGVDPTVMGIGPVPAIRQALEAAGLGLEQMDVIEVNEAFAPQYLAVEKALGLDPARTNVNGGAIALGHPLGATGTRITLHLGMEMARRRARYGIASACIGGGQGMALLLERS